MPAVWAFVACFLVSPLFVWRNTKIIAAIVITLASYVMGLYVFVTGCGVTWYYLGGFWFVVLLFFLGVGPVFASIILFLWHGQLSDTGYMVGALAAIYVSRAISVSATRNVN